MLQEGSQVFLVSGTLEFSHLLSSSEYHTAQTACYSPLKASESPFPSSREGP
jgi:hypothetical protein